MQRLANKWTRVESRQRGCAAAIGCACAARAVRGALLAAAFVPAIAASGAAGEKVRAEGAGAPVFVPPLSAPGGIVDVEDAAQGTKPAGLLNDADAAATGDAPVEALANKGDQSARELSADARPLGPSTGRKTAGGGGNVGDRASAPAAGVASRRAAAGRDAESALLSGHVMSTVLALGLVLGLMLALAAVTKKVAGKRAGSSLASALGPGGTSPSGVMEVLGRYPVARGQSLVLLRVDQRVLLLSHTQAPLRLRGGGGGGFATLAEFTEPHEVASLLMRTSEQANESLTAKFRASLERFDSRHEDVQAATVRPGAAALPARAVRRESASELRLIHASDDGDRVELWNPNAVAPAAASLDGVGASGVAAAAGAPHPARTGAGDSSAFSTGVRAARGGSAATESDPMLSLRSRLAGLRGRGVSG